MSTTIDFGFSVMKSSNPVKEKANVKPIPAIILPGDKVKDKYGKIYPIDNKSITIKGCKIYYTRDAVIISGYPYMGVNNNARPYFINMKVKGYINKDKHFIITKYEHKF